MAKNGPDAAAMANQIIGEVRAGHFSPVYLLMGEEPFYPDMVCDAIIRNALDESERDFNETVCYGSDVDVETVISAARRYPMMADRQLVVVKEAQMMKDLEKLAVYCENPLDSTVFVVLMHYASADKRKAFYKAVQKVGIILDSPAIRDYEISGWIISYYRGRGLDIDPRAAALLGEYAGTDLNTIALETDKLVRNLPEKSVAVTVEDIEQNVGISRQYSIFELTGALSRKNASDALTIAARVGSTSRFAMPMAVSALYAHFYRILKYAALLKVNPRPEPAEKARVLGVSPFFFREYDTALQNYPLRGCMTAISLLSDYDFKGKGGDIGSTTPQGVILVELVSKLLNI